ncbi:hypothetical protein DQ04_17191000 [Trypanosoma grayi]|uniref:hypothetical protein n=1 Tax=Trypanosoma grayi TaxID=71804 RepID=UPI0004F4A64B|nr:hypothetical protein DQ04_17191000 [Trypanosoma grayi]KEG05934.1 hypothetical protein DQ04_17191000 [Trypanosoma grayi]
MPKPFRQTLRGSITAAVSVNAPSRHTPHSNDTSPYATDSMARYVYTQCATGTVAVVVAPPTLVNHSRCTSKMLSSRKPVSSATQLDQCWRNRRPRYTSLSTPYTYTCVTTRLPKRMRRVGRDDSGNVGRAMESVERLEA